MVTACDAEVVIGPLHLPHNRMCRSKYGSCSIGSSDRRFGSRVRRLAIASHAAMASSSSTMAGCTPSTKAGPLSTLPK